MAFYESSVLLKGSQEPTGLPGNYSKQGQLSEFTVDKEKFHIKIDSSSNASSTNHNAELIGGPQNRPVAYYDSSTKTLVALSQSIPKSVKDALANKSFVDAVIASIYYTTLKGTGGNTQKTTQISGIDQSNITSATFKPPGTGLQPPDPSTTANNTNSADPTLWDLNIDKLKENFKFGTVDKWFDTIPKPLKYPEDALYDGVSQDYLQIAQYHYAPPKSEQLFETDAFKEILKTGLQKTSALEEYLGMVKLPMPNAISDSNNVSWGDDNMNNLSAAATADVIQNLGKYAVSGGVSGLISALAGSGFDAGSTLGVLGPLLYKFLTEGSASESAQAMIKTTGASKILSMAGVSVSPESILARGFGVVPNSNLELLFNSPTLREFQFQYRMSPRSEPEAKIVNQIIRFFKQGMAAKKQDKRSGITEYGSAGAASYFLGTPNVFQLQYKTSNNSPIKGVNRIKTCALVGFSVNYTPDGTWAAYDKGQPVSVIMNMAFKELEPIYDTDYQENVIPERLYNEGGTTNTGDLYQIQDDEVGY